MSATLTTSDYNAMPAHIRAEFDAWMKANNLWDAWIVEGTFDEGVLHAKVVARDAEGEAILTLDEEDVELKPKTFALVTPPPASVRPYLR